MAVRAVPYRVEFLKKFAVHENDTEDPEFYKILFRDIEEYVTALDVVIKILQDFYSANNLDDEEQV